MPRAALIVAAAAPIATTTAGTPGQVGVVVARERRVHRHSPAAAIALARPASATVVAARPAAAARNRDGRAARRQSLQRDGRSGRGQPGRAEAEQGEAGNHHGPLASG